MHTVPLALDGGRPLAAIVEEWAPRTPRARR